MLGAGDAGGYYYIADRFKRMINASGFKVWPAELEATLYKHPDIMEWSRGHMAAYKVPRIVEFTDQLPRSGTGKIQWCALQEKEWEGVSKP